MCSAKHKKGGRRGGEGKSEEEDSRRENLFGAPENSTGASAKMVAPAVLLLLVP